MISIRKVRQPKGSKALGTLASTGVNRDAAPAPQGELSAPAPMIAERQSSNLDPKPKSVDLGSSKPCSGLTIARAASVPQSGQSTPPAAGLTRFTESRASAPLMSKPLVSTSASSDKATALETIGGMSNMPSHAVDDASENSASRQSDRFKTPGLVILRYRTENTHPPATVERPRPVIQSLDDTISKRKRVENQAEVSTVPPPKRNRTLWSTPAYDPSKDPTMMVAMKPEPTTVISAALPAAPMIAAPRTAITLVKLPRTVRSKVDSKNKNNREGTSKAFAASKTTPAKPKTTRTENFNVPCNSSNTQSSPSKISNHTPVVPPPTPASPPTILPAPSTNLTPTASNAKVSKPWTSREYAELATLAFHSFPFAAFAATHSKTQAEVFNTFSAIIQLPILKHSANGLARAKLARDRVRAFKNGLKEVKEKHKAEEKEARKNAGPANSKMRDVVWKPDEERLGWPFGN